jgi:hypothetical protein
MPVRAAEAIWVPHSHEQHTMNDTARRLRAQKAYSTDPAYLERMAREEETRGIHPTYDATAENGSAFARRPNARAAVRDRPNQ